MSGWEDYFDNQLKHTELPPWEREYRFMPKPPSGKQRQFRFDFAWPINGFAVEIEGGVYSGGRHTTGAGFTKDCEKYALATIEGYRIIRVTTSQVSSGVALEWVKEFFKRNVSED